MTLRTEDDLEVLKRIKKTFPFQAKETSQKVPAKPRQFDKKEDAKNRRAGWRK